MVRYEAKPIHDADGSVVSGLHAIWITLDNPKQYNSYTTDMVKEVILGFRRASCDRAAVAVVQSLRHLTRLTFLNTHVRM